MLFRTSVGIEISGKHLRIAVVRGFTGRLRFVQSLEIPGFVDLAPEEQRASVSKLVQRHKLPSGHVHLSLPRDRGVVRQMEFPLEVREKLRSAVTLQLETLSPWPAEEVYWDFAEETPKKGAKNIRITVGIVPRVALDPWIDFFKTVKLPLSGACLSSVACAHGVRALWTDEAPAFVLDCETGCVEASLIQGTRLISITEKTDDPATAVKTVVARLIAAGRVTSPESARLLAYGSMAAAAGSLDRITLPIENAKPETVDRFGAVAAALAGLKKTAFDVNLVPRPLRYRQNQLQLVPTYVLIVFAVLLGLGMAARDPYQSMVYASRLDAEIQKIAPEVRDVASQESELNRLSEKYRALAAHLQGRDFNLEVLRELSRSLPPAAWLTNYSFQDGTITISGFAGSASEVQKALEDTALLKEVQFTTSVTRDASGKDRFTLKASIEAPR